MENRHGLKFEHPLRRLQETVELIRLGIRGEPVDYEGDVFRLKGAQLSCPRVCSLRHRRVDGPAPCGARYSLAFASGTVGWGTASVEAGDRASGGGAAAAAKPRRPSSAPSAWAEWPVSTDGGADTDRKFSVPGTASMSAGSCAIAFTRSAPVCSYGSA